MTDAPPPAALTRLEDWARKARKAGIVAAVPFFAGFLVDGAQFFRSYLFAFLVWAGLGIGCFSLFLMHSLTGGGWGKPIRRILEAGAKTLPLVALMFVPVLAGIGSLYEWSHGDVVDHDAILTHKKPYLNVPFFILRAAFYFAVWIVLARVLLALGRRYEASADARVRWHRARVAAGGILAYVMTMTFAAIDWGMSLEAHWFSTIYGLHFVVGQALGGFAVAILVAGWLSRHEPYRDAWTDDQFQDLGNLLVAFVMLWGYMALSQFLIIWSGNLPEETPWYLHRTAGGWQLVAVAMVTFHFAVPFLMLLSRNRKRDPRRLMKVARIVVLARVLDYFWLVIPAFPDTNAFHAAWMSIAALIALGGVWVPWFVRLVAAGPQLPEPDPRPGELQEATAS